jgi:hypothetical protein
MSRGALREATFLDDVDRQSSPMQDPRQTRHPCLTFGVLFANVLFTRSLTISHQQGAGVYPAPAVRIAGSDWNDGEFRGRLDHTAKATQLKESI